MKMCSVANLWLGTCKTKSDTEDMGKLQEAILRLGPELPASSLMRKVLKLPAGQPKVRRAPQNTFVVLEQSM